MRPEAEDLAGRNDDAIQPPGRDAQVLHLAQLQGALIDIIIGIKRGGDFRQKLAARIVHAFEPVRAPP